MYFLLLLGHRALLNWFLTDDSHLSAPIVCGIGQVVSLNTRNLSIRKKNLKSRKGKKISRKQQATSDPKNNDQSEHEEKNNKTGMILKARLRYKLVRRFSSV